jgi:hypothetical protein
VFGITQSVPTVETLSTLGYAALIRSNAQGIEILAGSLSVTGDVYFVTWALELTFRMDIGQG